MEAGLTSTRHARYSARAGPLSRVNGGQGGGTRWQLGDWLARGPLAPFIPIHCSTVTLSLAGCTFLGQVLSSHGQDGFSLAAFTSSHYTTWLPCDVQVGEVTKEGFPEEEVFDLGLS